MRNIKSKVLLCLLMISLLFTSTVYAKENNLLINKDTTKPIDNIIIDKDLELSIENNIYSLTNSKVSINKIIQLYVL